MMFVLQLFRDTPLAVVARQLVSGIEIFGSVCLNDEVGGLNFHALEVSAKLGAKVVWMPTISSAASRAYSAARLGLRLEGEGFSILDAQGKLVPEMGRILSLIREYDMVLASGHMSASEIIALVEEARRIGIKKIVITHPWNSPVTEHGLNMEQIQQLGGVGAFIEFCVLRLLPATFSDEPASMAEAIKTIGPEHCIMSTDLGQIQNPWPVEGMRLFMATLLTNGITAEEIELMAKINPAMLLSLD